MEEWLPNCAAKGHCDTEHLNVLESNQFAISDHMLMWYDDL